ncbi:chorismate lyase [Vibrio breoganii]|uniref:chorismate lyase n=1 Tax=Vibrio breoganii TaxID=553239 RepID=UPI0003644CD3|nr:chorismate lyase [Vibrio breoganii]OCH72979.1 chorismate--pyruvate lyase [Vibrio breoganii]OEF86841.1 chorismate--pyruvate lyase [Vibrio breoganii 1C10]PMF99017.1 chorismate--pyruvate lyase [Vibrio breoganii]PMG01453.1 chorismate--pyruvate lyase [Vibrio breoganii]PMG11536.1 chorismate--pyruvate lyase [Vibrio breoganii]
MTSPIRTFQQALLNINWQSPSDFQFPDNNAKHWLLEEDSLSHRLSLSCSDLSVELFTSNKVQPEELSTQEAQVLNKEVCLLREVILRGDRHDWVYGRTLIPQSSLQSHSHDFENQGELPLGVTVFSSEGAYRDGLQVGIIDVEGQSLLARRSRLWMNGTPMLVAELFLPKSPVYSDKESD